MNLPSFRAVYRTIELSGGWNGKIIGTQVLFSAFFYLFVVNQLNDPSFLQTSLMEL